MNSERGTFLPEDRNCNDSFSDIKANDLESRSGSIQAAINLEIAGDIVHRFNLKLEGLNGQFPNLDLVNTVSKLCRREGIPPALHKRVGNLSTIEPKHCHNSGKKSVHNERLSDC